MSSLFKVSPAKKTSQAMARCILLGVGGIVSTYLISEVVPFYGADIPFSFHLTCGLVVAVILLATLTALYRLSLPSSFSVENSNFIKKPLKSTHSADRSIRTQRSPLVVPLSFNKNEIAWFERN